MLAARGSATLLLGLLLMLLTRTRGHDRIALSLVQLMVLRDMLTRLLSAVLARLTLVVVIVLLLRHGVGRVEVVEW